MDADTALKRCCECRELKPPSAFNKRKRSRDGLQTICRTCSNARSRRYYADNREAHARAVTERNKRWKTEIKKQLLGYLSTHPCVDCGCTDVRVLEFDHLRDKEYGIASMLGSALSWQRILQEIAKCEVRCSNCHRIKTYERKSCYKSVTLGVPS